MPPSPARFAALSLALSLVLPAAFAGAAAAQQDKKAEKKKAEPYNPTDAEKAKVRAEMDKLAGLLDQYKAKHPLDDPRHADPYADVAVYHKAAEWILRHNEFYTQAFYANTLKALARGLERAAGLSGGKPPWATARGSIIRGYLSKVDGSVQPYAVVVPQSYTGAARVRLDVVLHGRGATLNEVSFINSHDAKAAGDGAGIVLHVFGRTNNAYRWAGETDVFEAIDAVKRNYRIDERRIVLRGFSMGGAGAWHLGLHHPHLWCSVEAGAGFSDTVRYANQKNLPDYQLRTLHIYDAVDYAGNIFNVPTAGYGGEKDPQLQASVNIKEALEKLGYKMTVDGLVTRGEGIDFMHVVGAGQGHSVDAAGAALLKAFHNERAVKGADANPRHIRFTTYTLKYSRAEWLAVEKLKEHYKRATVDAEIKDGTVHVKTENVSVLSIDRMVADKARIDDRGFPLASAAKGLLPEVYFRTVGGQWEFQQNPDRRKRRNLQGPIDDAFAGPFLCVRGTGQAWNPAVHKWAEARLDRFAKDWSKWMRGDLRIKNDVDVNADDMDKYSLILFGDPGSNSLIAKVLPELPVVWRKDRVNLGGDYSAADHVPLLIAPSPLSPNRYVVLNSGHTFGAGDFAGTNALLFPKLGDYAVLRIGAGADTVEISGFFNESWQFK
jgi:hypothetical protein